MERSRSLTPRQEEIVGLAAEGLTDKEISLRMGVSVGTLRSHWDRIRQRTGVSCRGAAIAALLDAGRASLMTEVEVLRRALAETGVFVWTARTDGFVDYVSEAFARFGGMSMPELIGPGCRALMIDTELRESGERWRRAQDSAQGYFAQVLFRSALGDLVPHRIRLTPMTGTDGEVARWLGVAHRFSL